MSRTIEQTLHIRARPETVWRFFTDPARLARWWGTAELDAVPGGALRVAMHEGPRPMMRGRFVEFVPYERLVFTFGWEATPGAPDIPPESSEIEWAVFCIRRKPARLRGCGRIRPEKALGRIPRIACP